MEKSLISSLFRDPVVKKEINNTETLKKILEEKNRNADIYQKNYRIQEYADLKEQLRQQLNNAEVNVDLEELFTKLDICVKTQSNWKNYSYSTIDQVRHSLLLLFIYYFGIKDSAFDLDKNYISFSEYIKKKNVSIITTNWDTICEQIIAKSTQKADLCFPYYTRHSKNHIKIAKVHGSINWFSCLNCGHVEVKKTKEEINFLLQKEGEFCKKCKCKQKGTHQFVPEIITPTMVKSFTHSVYSSIWQNAIDILQKAHKIVFIGYSLPLADFELRQILTKYLPSKAEIDVVLYKDCIKKDEREVPEDRYKRTFPKNKMQFYYDGFTTYFDTNK